MIFEWSTIIWLFGAFLAVSTFLRLCNARAAKLRGLLNDWLQAEIKMIHQKKRLLAIARKKRAELKIQQELQAASVAEEIKKLEISRLVAEKKEQDRQHDQEIAEKAKELKAMRERAA